MEEGLGIPDSTFVNFQRTISDIERAQTRSGSKKRGLRGVNNLDVTTLAANLKQDMLSIVASPLSRSKGLQPISELSADGIQALRCLHSLLDEIVKEGRDSDKEKGLEAMVKEAVRLLRNEDLELEAEAEAAVEQELDGSSAAGLSSLENRRSSRLAQLAKKSYDESGFDEYEFELEGEEGEVSEEGERSEEGKGSEEAKEGEGLEEAESDDVNMVDAEDEGQMDQEVV